MYATKLKKIITSNLTQSNAPTTDTHELQVVQGKSPRWIHAQEQTFISKSLFMRMPELFNAIQAHLKFRAFLNLMSTCKAMYNYCLNLLVLRAVIPISLKLPDDQTFKLVFAAQNNIPFKFEIDLSDLEEPNFLIKALNNNPSLTLLIKDNKELTQLMSLLLNTQLSQNQLRLLSQITALDLSLFPVQSDIYHNFKALFDILSENIIFCKLQSLSLGFFCSIPNISTLDLSKLSIKNLFLGCVSPSIKDIHFPASLKSLSLDCEVHPNFSKFPPFLETLYFKQIMVQLDLSTLPPLENLHLIGVNKNQDLSKLASANLKNLSIKVSGSFPYELNLSKLPDSLKNFSLDLASKDHQLSRGNTIITIKKGCEDINILFSKNHYFPCITSSNNDAITVSKKNTALCTASAIAIAQKNSHTDEQCYFLLFLLLINQCSDLLSTILWYVDFPTSINLVSTCKALRQLGISFLKQRAAMITFPLSDLDGTKIVHQAKTAKLQFARAYTGICPKIAISDLLNPSEFLINALKEEDLRLTLEIKNDNEIKLLKQCLSSNLPSKSQLAILTKIKHLNLTQCMTDFFFSNTTHFKHLTQLSLVSMSTWDLSKSFQTLQHLHLNAFFGKFDWAKLPPFIIKLSFSRLDHNFDFSKINPLIENIMITTVGPFDIKLTFKNGVILEIKENAKDLDIKIPLKNGCPDIANITSKDNKRITITSASPQTVSFLVGL